MDCRNFYYAQEGWTHALGFRFLSPQQGSQAQVLPSAKDQRNSFKFYKFLSKLDLLMQYYTFELDKESKDLCAIATPCGLFCHTCPPMGVSPAPDVAQAIMEHVLALIKEIEVCLDDVTAFLDNWESHLVLLEKLLTLMQEKCFWVNPAKCTWGIQETNFLGHWLMPERKIHTI